MVVLKVYGGLAGQMFQYSLGRYLSIKNNTPLYLDTSWYKKEKSTGFIRDFGLNHLNTHFKAFDKKSPLWWLLKVSGKMEKFNPAGFTFVKENDFTTFDPAILKLGNNVVLDGYWNSHRYFESIRETLVNELRPKEAPDNKNTTTLQKINEVDAISIHFRRGDYALTSFHGILSKEYYEKAIDAVAGSMSNPHLFIFSDEPEWVLSNMQFSFPYTIVDFNKDEKNYWDIELMKNCKHNIIANSGFSWWAAWLNDNEGKMVVAPQKWINVEKTSFENIPAGWLLL